ncbi:MAG: hypothetical protein ACREK8_03065 [Gemmatimonadales bacterium]
MMRQPYLILALAACFPAASAVAQAARPAQVILIRHAEKPDDPRNPHLSPAGVKRAERLVGFIANDPLMKRFGPPVAIYATHMTNDGDGQRTAETVAPLAKALRLKVLTPAVGKNYDVVAQEVLGNPAYAGKTVVICWNHEEIPQLAAALGVRPIPPRWKGSVFDEVYIITWHGKRATITMARY